MESLTRWTWVWASWIDDGQGSLACCSPWGRKESDITDWVIKNSGWRFITFYRRRWSKPFPTMSWRISVQLNLSVMSDSLRPHGLQHARPPCPSPTPRVYPNSCPLSWWWHPTISSSIVPFSFHLQSFPASRSFQMSQLFASGAQSVGVSASTSVLPMNTQDWSPLGWTGWISLQSKGLSRVFSNTTVQKHQFFGTQLSLWSSLTSIHDYWKNHGLD